MLKVFLSYASEDRNLVVPYHRQLKAHGFVPWMDFVDILPGLQWRACVERAFNAANVVLLFLSPRSVNKRGLVQWEANQALQNLKLKMPEDVYAIPLVLEDCEVPAHISDLLQYTRLSDEGAWEIVLRSLELAAEQQQVRIAKGVEHGPFRVFDTTIEEVAKGVPGHDIKIQYPNIHSEECADAARELSQLFAGRAMQTVMKARSTPWNQIPHLFSGPDEDADEEFSTRRNGRWESYDIVNANPHFVSVAITVAWYGAGAAHQNYFFECFNAAIVDHRLVQVDLGDVFIDTAAAMQKISELCIDSLKREYWRRAGEAPDEEAIKWIVGGCNPQDESLHTFNIKQDGITFLFPPYQVGPFAMSTWDVHVSYFDLLPYLKRDGAHQWARGLARGALSQDMADR